jgi:hypothetical protein
MTRERLPNRRSQITESISWGGSRIHVSAGFSRDGRILETFLRGGGRVGSDRDHQLDDIAVVLSRLLQHGDRLADIARGVGRLPDGEPASIVGAVMDRLVEIEADPS